MNEISNYIKQILQGIDYILRIYQQKPESVRLEFLYKALLASIERPLLRASLKLTDNDLDDAAKIMGLSKKTLAQKLIEYNASSQPELSPEKQLESWIPYQLNKKDVKLPLKKPNNHKRYYLDPTDPDLYLTQREGDCMWELLKENTYKKIGNALGISHRTVEYYIHNVQIKLKCNSRLELISLLKKSDFISEYVDKN